MGLSTTLMTLLVSGIVLLSISPGWGQGPPQLKDVPYKMTWRQFAISKLDHQFVVSEHLEAYVNQTAGLARIINEDTGVHWIVQEPLNSLIQVTYRKGVTPECDISRFSTLRTPLGLIMPITGQAPTVPGRNNVFGLTENTTGVPSGQGVDVFTDILVTPEGIYNASYIFFPQNVTSVSFNVSESYMQQVELDSDESNYTYIFIIGSATALKPSEWEMFEIPEGVHCPAQNPLSVTVPDNFQFSMELIPMTALAGDPSPPVNFQIFYDYGDMLFRSDRGLGHSSGIFTYGSTQITTVQDFKFGIQYTMNSLVGDCTVEPINTTFTFDLGQVRTTASGQQFVHLANINDYLASRNYTHQSKRMIRGLLADVYAYREGDTIHEIYFGPLEFCDSAGGLEPAHPQIGNAAYVRGELTVRVNTGGYSACPIRWSTFEVDRCVGAAGITAEDVLFTMKTTESVEGRLSVDRAINSVREALAVTLNVSKLQVSDILLQPFSSPTSVYCIFALLSHPKVQGNVEAPPSESHVYEAVAKLRKFDGIFTLPFVNDSGLYYHNFTLRVTTVDRLSDLYLSFLRPSSRRSLGYTPGAMAGLGLGMFILGALLALVFGAVLLRRRLNIRIPYTQDVM